MSILVVCIGCHTRFKVSDKFAGKSGPCPKCKTVLQIPTKNEEVKVHAPEEFGGKNAAGQAIFKPIVKRQLSITPSGWTLIVSAAILIPVVAFIMGRKLLEEPDWLVRMVTLGAGALLVAPLLVWAGYSFLRNDELEPYRGLSLWIRVGICSVIYAALWGIYAYMVTMIVGDGDVSPEVFHLLVIVPVLVVAGGITALAALELDATSAGLHYGFYLLVTVLLRLIMGIDPF